MMDLAMPNCNISVCDCACVCACFWNITRTISGTSTDPVGTNSPYGDQKTGCNVTKHSDSLDGFGVMICIAAGLEQVRN